MSAEAIVYNMAQCKGCPSDKGGHPRPFASHLERATWVGKHRVATGHSVDMWLEPLVPRQVKP